MNVYSSAAASAVPFKKYLTDQTDAIQRALDPHTLNVNPQLASIITANANNNIQFANDVMGLILKNITSLQP